MPHKFCQTAPIANIWTSSCQPNFDGTVLYDTKQPWWWLLLGVQSKVHQSPRKARADALLSAGCQDLSIIA
jgi:hypothetical protein